jgi:hypothetical protein
MAKPNYNLIKFIRRCVYQMKHEYGGNITLYLLDAVATDYQEGTKTESHTSYPITRAIVLPLRIKREVIQTISMISANKKFVQGGTFDSGTRTFIIDRRDVPTVTSIRNDDWIVYNSKRYEIKWVDEFEQQTAWVVVGKEVEGVRVDEDIRYSASNAVDMADVASATIV